jgi:hypothetical protein
MERFAEVSVDTRQDRPVHHELAEGAALPGQGILQQDLSSVCIRYCLKLISGSKGVVHISPTDTVA